MSRGWPRLYVAAASAVLLVLLACPGPASAESWYLSVSHNADGAPPAYPWLDVDRRNTGINWTIVARAWSGNLSAALSFANVRNLTVDAAGWFDDAMDAAARLGARITLKMTSDTPVINFTFENVPRPVSLKRNGVSLAYTYTPSTKVLAVSVSFSPVTLEMAFEGLASTISALSLVVIALLTLMLVVAAFSGIIGLLGGTIGKFSRFGAFSRQRRR